eukprot:CAMPEP_0174256172 /NCGR_PEP_ID=MMETSP0439-20130205/5434_1 /TAXON_ID=0 /ORGANISM="Stereomyxa ramosa, Strain Chinc5" /LENGTH=620 /DNA_ID=CAMNT_0015338673 /DNA_START=256 /DNA_END=2118 /DNA_ORIENTATION=-
MEKLKHEHEQMEVLKMERLQIEGVKREEKKQKEKIEKDEDFALLQAVKKKQVEQQVNKRMKQAQLSGEADRAKKVVLKEGVEAELWDDKDWVAKWRHEIPEEQRFHGVLGLGPDGDPLWKPLPPLLNETVAQKRVSHNPNCFNLRTSDSLPLDREIPDVRSEKCLDIKYNIDTFPNTSVVFVFYQEPFSTLLRSVHSILNRTPPQLLHEIILVDDGSGSPWLQEDLENYLKVLPDKVKLVRAPERLGLMGARTLGAKTATGETVTFLDSHIEANPGWAEPLLARIAEDRRHVVMPVIDTIFADDFGYKAGGIDILGFDWNLGQTGVFRKVPEGEEHLYRPSPIMAGGLFTIDRKLFFELGAYDEEMKEWGGEELEISFRIWMCGNTLENAPCSHVGHIFRSSEYYKGRAYSITPGVIHRNKMRVVALWMDDFIPIVEEGFGKIDMKQVGDLGPLREIQRKFQCKDFKWYLDNVYPDLFRPDDSFVMHKGAIKNPTSNACIDTLGSRANEQPFGVWTCHKRATQKFLFSKTNEIRVVQSGYKFCLDRGNGKLMIYSCHGMKGNQYWDYDPNTLLLSSDGGQCLSLTSSQVVYSKNADNLKMARCDASDPLQHWTFEQPETR